MTNVRSHLPEQTSTKELCERCLIVIAREMGLHTHIHLTSTTWLTSIPDDNRDSLGMDSADLETILEALRKEFDFHLEEQEVRGARAIFNQMTVGNLQQFVCRKVHPNQRTQQTEAEPPVGDQLDGHA